MKRLLTFPAIAAITICVSAQTTAQIQAIQSELQKRGLNQAEVEQRLTQKGIDINSINATNYQQYQSQVMDVLGELEAEKKVGIATTGSYYGVTSNQKPYYEKINQKSADANNGETAQAIFGHNLFQSAENGFFNSSDGSLAPETYVLGEGDELHISIFGASQTDIRQRITTDGFIQPAGAAKIFLKGLTIAQARQAISNSLSTFYSFRPDQIVVTVVTARNVLVNVFGEVNKNGGYTLSALNSVLNVLSMAGGPTALGSIRDIQVIRNGKKHTLDLYAYVMDPDAKLKLDIQNNDVIYVPIVPCIVSIQGAVNRPMRYEIKPGEGLIDLIRYAGGPSSEAYNDLVQVRRQENGEMRLLEFNLTEVLSGAVNVPVANGDQVILRKMNQDVEKFVEIKGSVYYPGRYNFSENTTLSALIAHAKPNFSASTDLLFIERTHSDSTHQVLTVPYPGVNGQPDFPLQERDVVSIYDKATFNNRGTVSVVGAVKQTVQVDYTPNLNVHDLLIMAGGVTFGAAFDRIEVFRVNISPTDEMQLEQITLEIDSTYNLVGNSDFRVHPFDKFVVRLTPAFTTGRVVEINGQVKYPGSYVLTGKETRLTEIIEQAGGLLPDADPLGANLFRKYRDRGNVSVNLQEAMANKSLDSANPILFEGDIINISRKENTVTIMSIGTHMDLFSTDGYSNTQDTLYNKLKYGSTTAPNANRTSGYNELQYNEITKDSELLQNGGFKTAQSDWEKLESLFEDQGRKVVVFNGERNAKWYIKHYAGGFNKYADRSTVTVTLPNNQMEGTTVGFLWIRKYPKVKPGSTITMTLNEKRVKKAVEPKEKVNWATVSAQTTAAATTLVSLIALIKTL